MRSFSCKMLVCPRTSPNCKMCVFLALRDFYATIASDLQGLLQPFLHDVRLSGIFGGKSGCTFGNYKRPKMQLNSLFGKMWPGRSEIGLPSHLACKSASPLASKRAKQLRHWPTFASRVQIGVSLRVSHAKQLRNWLPSRLVCKSVSPFVSLRYGGWVGSR